MKSQQEIQILKDSVNSLVEGFDQIHLANQINELEAQLALPEVWNNHQKAAKLNQELALKQETLSKLKSFQDQLENLQVAVDLDDIQEVLKIFQQIENLKQEIENQKYLNGKFDQQGAILAVHAGAGGVDAQDWTAMLLSMYQAFSQKMNWKCNIVSLSSGEEGGLKSATLQISGNKAYGLLKEEAGVHRLVRLSPFNSSHTRETSFALIEVIPENVSAEVDFPEINEADLKWDTFMSSGKGGQSVNTTYSAVRLTHIPTGIVVTCQNERNQLQNKSMAIKYLQNKLAVLEARKQDELKKELRGEFHSAEWGSQIRNYVMHPYKLVKDIRSGWETVDVENVLSGEILDVIWSVKKYNASKSEY